MHGVVSDKISANRCPAGVDENGAAAALIPGPGQPRDQVRPIDEREGLGLVGARPVSLGHQTEERRPNPTEREANSP